MKSSPTLKLYWVESPDHHEDWFVVARTARAARRFFETSEGYARGDAISRLVLELPVELQSESGPYWTSPEIGPFAAPCWPSEEVLKLCGGTYLMKGATRVVEIAGETYAEGLLEAEIRGRVRLRSSDRLVQ